MFLPSKINAGLLITFCEREKKTLIEDHELYGGVALMWGVKVAL